MAKTNTVKHKFGVVDLVRKKPKLQFIELPKYKVDVVFEVTTTGKLKKPDPCPSTALKRLEAAGMKELERYEKVITDEAVKLDAKVGEILKKTPGAKGQTEAEKLIQGTNQSIKNAMASAEAAAQVAIQKRLKEEANKDKLLVEARAKTTLKVTMGVIKIGTAVTRLVASSGGDVLAYKTIAKQMYNLGKEIQQQRKGEEKLRKDLESAIQKYITLRGTTIMQAAKRHGLTDTSGLDIKKPLESINKMADKIIDAGLEVTKGKDAKQLRKEILDFTIKGINSYNKDADSKRQKYRENTTKARQEVDKYGAKADELMKVARAQSAPKGKVNAMGIKLGAEAMASKRYASSLAAVLEEREKFLKEMQSLMEANGLKVDDTTIYNKLKALDKKTALKETAAMVTSVSGIYKLVDEISDLAA